MWFQSVREGGVVYEDVMGVSYGVLDGFQGVSRDFGTRLESHEIPHKCPGTPLKRP